MGGEDVEGEEASVLAPGRRWGLPPPAGKGHPTGPGFPAHGRLRGRVSVRERSPPSFYLPGEARKVDESALGHSWSHSLGTAPAGGRKGGWCSCWGGGQATQACTQFYLAHLVFAGLVKSSQHLKVRFHITNK